MSGAKRTTDHKTIRKWAEERDGKPARVKRSKGSKGVGILRIDFGEPEPSLEPISWEEFFEVFEDRELAFLYQEEAGKGGTSRFFKLVHRDVEDDDESDDETSSERDDDEDDDDAGKGKEKETVGGGRSKRAKKRK